MHHDTKEAGEALVPVARSGSGELVERADVLSQVVALYMDNFLSEHTRQAYEVDFREFAAYLTHAERKISSPKEVSKADVIGFRDYLRKKFSPTTVNRKLSALSSLFSELQNARQVDVNPCDGVKRPPSKTTRELLGFSDPEVVKILSTFDEESLRGLKEKAVVAFLFYTGVRVSEAIAVRVSDLSNVDGIHVVRILGKGEKVRVLPVNPKLYAILRKLIDRLELRSEDYLFTRLQGDRKAPLTRVSVARFLKKAMKDAGVGTSRSCHSTRRTVVSTLLQSGARVESVAKLAGHASLNTTLRYNVRTENLEDNPLLTLKYRDTK
jgi:site-specific recombinase XerD